MRLQKHKRGVVLLRLAPWVNNKVNIVERKDSNKDRLGPRSQSEPPKLSVFDVSVCSSLVKSQLILSSL